MCHSAMPTKGTRTGPMREMMRFCIDFAGRRFLPRHINHLSTGHTTHSHASSRSRQCGNTNAKWEIKILQSQTECSLFNSISGATDYCTVYTLVYTILLCYIEHWVEYILKFIFNYKYNRTTMGLNRLWQMNLFAIKSDILESITNIGGPWGRGIGGTCPPPKFYWLHWGGTCPPKFLPEIHNDLKSLFEKNKQIRKFRKISWKCVQNFLKFFKNL